ncbi:MAG: acyltransferase [Hespellia sp.]|nr:acyltransferase [Hespellia sp.]
MKRNRGVDIFRALAILFVLVYHFYVLLGEGYADSHLILHRLISAGGEVGVTLFFIISGYGIFLSIDYKMNSRSFEILQFYKKRFLRILPQYYISLLIIIFLTSQVSMLSSQGLFHIFTHAFLIHNFFPSTCGSINTILWTMGVIAQFYLISVLLYKAVKKNALVAFVGSIIFTVVSKIVLYHVIFPRISIESTYYFIYGRQLFSALDNFVAGMFLAALPKTEIRKNIRGIYILAGVVLVIAWIVIPEPAGKYTDTWMGYVWHSVLVILLGIAMWGTSNLKFREDSIVMRVILFISKYQYGIYLWHFAVAANLLHGSRWIMVIAAKSFWAVALVLTVICTMIGYLSTITLEAPDYENILKFGKK